MKEKVFNIPAELLVYRGNLKKNHWPMYLRLLVLSHYCTLQILRGPDKTQIAEFRPQSFSLSRFAIRLENLF